MKRPDTRHWPLLVPFTLSVVLSSWALRSAGWGNTYYAAAVRSMSESWHAFIYGALDSKGFVTVDKPPLSMWVQAIVVKVFGYHQYSLLIPQVVAGVLAVVLVYATLVRRWGRAAATFGATALAIMPISVVVNHSNNTDAILTLLMTACACTCVRAVETSRLRWVIVSAALFGAAFTTKMLAAAPVLPAIFIALALGSTLAWRRRSVHLAVGAAVAVTTALAWFTFVDLTPASERPYVGSSATNSAYQLAFERNGVNQVEGDASVMGGGAPTGGQPGGGPPGGGARPGGSTGTTPEGMSGFSGGDAGPLRLFNDALGTQIGWLVLPGLAGLIGAAVVAKRRRPWLEPTLVVPAVWFVVGAGAYSITEGIVHPYYVASIVPPLAILFGAGVGAAHLHGHRRAVVGVVGGVVASSGLVAWLIARRSTYGITTAAGIITILLGLALAVTAVASKRQLHRAALVGALAIMLVAPLTWTIGSLEAGFSANLPYADPSSGGGPGGGGPGGGPGGGQLSVELVDYLLAHRGDATWLVAVSSAMTAAPIIIDTGEPVMALGGFSGNDAVLSDADFDALVADGKVRFVLDSFGGGFGAGSRGVLAHVAEVCTPVAAISSSLYDCAP